MAPPGNIDELSNAELRALVVKLFELMTDLERTVAAQREEIARLKGPKGRPDIKPNKLSGMDQATKDKPKTSGQNTGRGPKRTPRVAVEDRVITTPVPKDARFKGYQDFVVQELVISPQVIRFQRERWLTADGKTVIAPLPAGYNGHFEPELRRFVLMQHHQGQSLPPRRRG